MSDNHVWIYAEEVYQTLNGSWAKGKNLRGYCHYHKRYVTRPQMNLHKCEEKKCKRLERIR